MMSLLKITAPVAFLVLLTACNTTGSQVTGEAPQVSSAVMEKMYVRLADVAAGRAKRKSMISTVRADMRRQDAEIAASDTMRLASSGVSTVTNAAMTGGASLIEDGIGLGMQASGVGTVTGQMAMARAQQEAALSQAEAAQAKMWADSEADVPAQAAALLKVLDRVSSGQTSWRNPKTGASGTVTIEAVPASASNGKDCRSVLALRDGATSGGVSVMTLCKEAGEWWIIG